MSYSDSDNEDGIYQVGSSDYIYQKNAEKYNIGVKNYGLLNEEKQGIVISNYVISSDKRFTLFATIVWNDIEYKDGDYNPYNYDPEPNSLVYRDDLTEEEQQKYLKIIDELSNEFYEPTEHYRHFNPALPKVKLSEFEKETKYAHIVNAFKDLFKYFDNVN